MHSRFLLLLLFLLPGCLAAQTAQTGRSAPVASERQPALVPRTSFDGPVLEFDFPGMQVGVAEYEEGPTGATVFYFPDGVAAAIDVRGGAPGTIATDFLRLGYSSTFVDAITFAGGSSYGLAAAAGVAMEIKSMWEDSGDEGGIATVPGAIIFDLGNRRFNTIVPDAALGRAALRAAEPGRFPLGPRGAGRFAMQAGYYGNGNRQHSGQGGAFRQIGPTKIAVFTVVNALGAVANREGEVVRCSSDPTAEDCGSVADYLARTLDERIRISRASAPAPEQGPTTNTTLTLVVTNQKLDFWELQRLAIQVHSSMARAIQPFHTRADGDVLFAVTTDEVEDPELRLEDLGVIASEVAWDAVLNSVPPLPTFDTTVVQVDPEIYSAYVGEYEFGREAVLTITREGERIFAEATGRQRVYGFTLNERMEILPTSEAHFISNNRRGDHLRVLSDGRGQVSGLVLNPGPWGLPAQKVR